MTHGAPEAGREVGLMYSFSSPSGSTMSSLTGAAATAWKGLEPVGGRGGQVSIGINSLHSPCIVRATLIMLTEAAVVHLHLVS